MTKYLKRLYTYTLIFFFLITFFLANVNVSGFNPIYRKFYDNWFNIISYITNKTILNIGDILYFTLILIIIYFFINIKKNRRRDNIFKIFLFSSIIYSLFYWSWGFNYKYPKKVEIRNINYTDKKLKETLDYYIHLTNKFHLEITNSKNEIAKSKLSFSEIGSICKVYFKQNTKHKNFKINESYFSDIISYFGFTGYINPISLESNVNNNIPKVYLPTTISHEIAHQIGYSKENEANFYSIKSTLDSKNNFIKYSGSFMALQYLLYEVRKIDKSYFDIKIKEINYGILENFNEINRYLEKYDNQIEPYIKNLYDKFLKKNNQVYGIRSYNMVVNLLVSDYYQSKIKTSKSDSN